MKLSMLYASEESKNNPLRQGNRYIFLKNEDNLTQKLKKTKQELRERKIPLKINTRYAHTGIISTNL